MDRVVLPLSQDKTQEPDARVLHESPIQGILDWILSLFLWFVGLQLARVCGVIVFG